MMESGTPRKGTTFYYFFFFFIINTCVHPQVLHRLHCWQHGSDLVTAEKEGPRQAQ